MGSKVKVDYDALVGIVIALVGLIYGFAGFMLPRATVGVPFSPSYFPVILGGVLFALGVGLFLRSDMSRTKESLKALKNMSEKEKAYSKLITLTAVSCLLYAVIFEHLGFVISTFIFLEAMMYLTNKKGIKINTIVSLCFSIIVYIIFSNFLGIMLPTIPFLNI